MTLLILVMCLYRYRERSQETKLLALIFLLSMIVTIIVDFSSVSGVGRNIPQNLWAISMIIILLVMYDRTWKHRYRLLTIPSACIFGAFSLWNLFFGQGIMFNSYTLALGALIILAHTLVYFYDLLVKLPVEKLERLPMFWFNAAYLFYFASSLFIFAAYFVEAFRDSLRLSWAIQNVLRIIQFILIIVGLWQEHRNIRLRSSLESVR